MQHSSTGRTGLVQPTRVGPHALGRGVARFSSATSGWCQQPSGPAAQQPGLSLQRSSGPAAPHSPAPAVLATNRAKKAVPADNEQRQEQRRAAAPCTHRIYRAHSHGTGRESGGDVRPSWVRATVTTGTYARTHVHIHTYACRLCHIIFILYSQFARNQGGADDFPDRCVCVPAPGAADGWTDLRFEQATSDSW